MLKPLLLVLALAGAPAVLAAQNAAPELEAPSQVPGVTLTVSGYLLPDSAGPLAYPKIWDAAWQAAGSLPYGAVLLSVDTAPVSGRVVAQVRFGFSNTGYLSPDW